MRSLLSREGYSQAGDRMNPVQPSGNVSMNSVLVSTVNSCYEISSLAVNGQSFLVIDGYLLNPVTSRNPNPGLRAQETSSISSSMS